MDNYCLEHILQPIHTVNWEKNNYVDNDHILLQSTVSVFYHEDIVTCPSEDSKFLINSHRIVWMYPPIRNLHLQAYSGCIFVSLIFVTLIFLEYICWLCFNELLAKDEGAFIKVAEIRKHNIFKPIFLVLWIVGNKVLGIPHQVSLQFNNNNGCHCPTLISAWFLVLLSGLSFTFQCSLRWTFLNICLAFVAL